LNFTSIEKPLLTGKQSQRKLTAQISAFDEITGKKEKSTKKQGTMHLMSFRVVVLVIFILKSVNAAQCNTTANETATVSAVQIGGSILDIAPSNSATYITTF